MIGDFIHIDSSTIRGKTRNLLLSEVEGGALLSAPGSSDFFLPSLTTPSVVPDHCAGDCMEPFTRLYHVYGRQVCLLVLLCFFIFKYFCRARQKRRIETNF
jgi:hypothetical protein